MTIMTMMMTLFSETMTMAAAVKKSRSSRAAVAG